MDNTAKAHFQRFARYNLWANGRLYGAAAALPEACLWRDQGAFFGSLMGTLNHLLVGDQLWLARLTGAPAPALRLDTVLYRDLEPLRAARGETDLHLRQTMDDWPGSRFGETLSYASTNGQRWEQPVAEVLTHIFNHQTHHRGQAHVLVGQLGGTPPELDFIYFRRAESVPVPR